MLVLLLTRKGACTARLAEGRAQARANELPLVPAAALVALACLQLHFCAVHHELQSAELVPSCDALPDFADAHLPHRWYVITMAWLLLLVGGNAGRILCAGSILYQLLRVMKVLWRRCPGCCCCFGCCLTRRRNYQCSPTIIPTQMRASMFRPDFKLNKDRGLERVQTAFVNRGQCTVALAHAAVMLPSDESKAGRFSSIDELGDWSDAGSEYDNFSGAASSADGAVDLTRDLANAADTAAYVTRQYVPPIG